MLNETSLDTLCGALAYAMGIEPPAHAAPANKQLVEYIDQKLGGKRQTVSLCTIPTPLRSGYTKSTPS